MRDIVPLELCLIISLDVGALVGMISAARSLRARGNNIAFEYARSDEIYGSVVAIRQDVSRRTSVGRWL